MRAHSVPDRTIHVLRSRALIRAHWLPYRSKTSYDQELLSAHCLSGRPTNMLWSGVLIRAHCHPYWISNWPTNVSNWSSSILDRATHVLRSRAALIRAHWLPDWSEYPCDQELVSKLFDSPIDQQTCCSQEFLPELIKCFSNKNRGYRHPNWQSSFLPLGALIGAH